MMSVGGEGLHLAFWKCTCVLYDMGMVGMDGRLAL